MENDKIVKAIILIMENLEFGNDEIIERQLISCRDLIDTVIINITKDKKCDHPKEARKNLTCLRDKQKTEQCLICGETLIDQ